MWDDNDVEFQEDPLPPIVKTFQFESDQNWTTFFVEQYLQTIIINPLLVQETLMTVQYQSRTHVDADEYQHIHENEQQPLYLPRIDNFAGMVHGIRSNYDEGWVALLKGHLTQFCYRSLFKMIQPALEEVINDYFEVLEDLNPFTFVLTHTLTGALLSPLDLEEKKKPEESIFSVLYASKNLLPSIAYHSIGATIRFTSTYIIESELGLDSTFSPFLYKLSQLAFLGVECFLLCPLELARKRLFAQKLAVSNESKSSPIVESNVQTHNEPYRGVLDCIVSVINEEGKVHRSKRPKNVSKADWTKITGENPNDNSSESWKAAKGYINGFSSLFRGFWPKYASMLVLYISDDISNDDQW